MNDNDNGMVELKLRVNVCWLNCLPLVSWRWCGWPGTSWSAGTAPSPVMLMLIYNAINVII